MALLRFRRVTYPMRMADMTVSSGGSRHQLSGRWHEQSESTRAPAGKRSRTRLLGGPRVPKTTRQRSVSRTKLPSAGCQRKGRDLSQFARRTVVARQLRKHTGGQHTRILLAVFFLSLLRPAVRPLDRREPARGACGYIYCDPAEVRQSQQTPGRSGELQQATSALFSPTRATQSGRRGRRWPECSKQSLFPSFLPL